MKNWPNVKVVSVLSRNTTKHGERFWSAFTQGTLLPHQGWICCHLRAEVCCQGLVWQTEYCPGYTELFFAVDSNLISCFRQTLELDSVGAQTCKWYLQGFELEYCQSEWVRRRVWDVVCVCTVHIFMPVLVCLDIQMHRMYTVLYVHASVGYIQYT